MHHQKASRADPKSSSSDGADKTIVVRDRRKPNQYTTNNVIAREWLPILRVGDAFFFYSIYLSMANRETESSWGSLRTQAKYLQCGVDLIVRGNKLLEICELIYIDTGNYRTTNEYYILEPPPLTPELKARIHGRLDGIAAQETSVNWQSWVKQVRKALCRHRSLPSIWADRRRRRGGRPVKAIHTQPPASDQQEPRRINDVREPQAPPHAPVNAPGCESQPGGLWLTTRSVVSHKPGERGSQPKQEQETRLHEQDQKSKESILALVREWCHQLGIASTAVEGLLERYSAERVLQQLEWLSFRNPRDPAAMLISAVQGDWEKPIQYSGGDDLAPSEWLPDRSIAALGEHKSGIDSCCVEGESETECDQAGENDDGFTVPGAELDARVAWDLAMAELRLQMTRVTFDTWLGGTEVVGVCGTRVSVLARDAYASEWLQARWYTPIQRTMSGIIGREVDIHFVAPEGLEV
jgi:hypothetical protein